MLRTIIPHYPPPSPTLPRKRGGGKGGLSYPECAVPARNGMWVVLRPTTEVAENQALLPSPCGTNPSGTDLNARSAARKGEWQDARSKGAGGATVFPVKPFLASKGCYF